MLRLVLLVASLVGVFGGSPPHPELVDDMVARNQGRYSNNILEDAKLDVPGLVAKYGYPVETHTVTTEDGYILTMHRIPHGRDRNSDPDVERPIAFLMHGLISSSADYLILGPSKSLGYILAEEGYDVWMGNARGNFYSRRHRRLNPDSRLNQNFWKFSWDEIGNLDLPACLDHIEKTTGQSKLHYIGHSQGGTSFLVLNSLRPEYNKKFISFQALAPAAYFTYNDQPTITAMANLENALESAAFALGQGEVFGTDSFILWFNDKFCHPGSLLEAICGSNSIADHSVYINETMKPVFRGHAPAGSSVRQFVHYGQSIRFDSFRRFNHGALTNRATYGSREPPEYDVSLVTAPSYIYFGDSDTLVHPKDVTKLASKLPNLRLFYLVQSPDFGHIDFIWASNAKTMLYNKVLSSMKEAEKLFDV